MGKESPGIEQVGNKMLEKGRRQRVIHDYSCKTRRPMGSSHHVQGHTPATASERRSAGKPTRRVLYLMLKTDEIRAEEE